MPIGTNEWNRLADQHRAEMVGLDAVTFEPYELRGEPYCPKTERADTFNSVRVDAPPILMKGEHNGKQFCVVIEGYKTVKRTTGHSPFTTLVIEPDIADVYEHARHYARQFKESDNAKP